MRRRDFLVGFGTASVWPGAALAQRNVRRLAFVHSGIPVGRLTESAGPFWVRRFYEALRRLGYVEGSNLLVERFSAEGHSEGYARLAADVVARKPDVIVANFNELIRAFMMATTTIPIIAIAGDPVAGGLATNLARPGGNVTGVTSNAGSEIYAKRLEILKEAIPSATRISHLVSVAPDGGDPALLTEAGARFGVNVTRVRLPIANESELERTFADFSQQSVDGLIVSESGSFLALRRALVGLAAQHRIHAMYPYRDYAEEGGLMALAPDLAELAERMADNVHQIFKGTKPGDIPFYQPSKFLLVFNLRTAKAMGLEIPANLVARANEVIE